MSTKLVKYWVWRGQAYPQSLWKTPCATCGEPTDYRLEEREDIYLADDVERVVTPMLADYIGMMEFLVKQAPGTLEKERTYVLVRLAEAQRLLAQLGRKG